jgi:hypothetical protein
MAIDRRERLIENLAVASALGFLTLIVAALSLAADSRATALEREALFPEGAASVVAGRADDPCFDRFYRIAGDAGPAYATMVALRSPSGTALFGARFAPDGELRDLRFLGSCSSRIPTGPRGLEAGFPGADAALGRAAAFARGLAARESGS